MKKKQKKHSGVFSTVLLVVLFVAGLSLILYPTVADHWNSLHQTHTIASYVDAVSSLDAETYERMWRDAVDFNARLADQGTQFALPKGEEQTYYDLLDIDGSGIMGYIDIPAIEVSLPVYHGTSEGVLQVAAGHLEWSSLPVGGEGSHCIISGHRGLPSARLFTDLDKLRVGDVFTLAVLSEVLTYEVDQILVVEPHDTKDLRIEPGKDYCTLLTCTPYGINTHRLLVRGHRVETEATSDYRVISEAVVIEPLIVAPIMAIPILLMVLLALLLRKPRRKHRPKVIDHIDPS